MQKALLSKIKNWIKSNKVIDVALFGSSNRGKKNPNDLDLCILISDMMEDNSIDLVHSLKQTLKDAGVHISILTSSSFMKGDTLARTVLNEGFSINQNKPFSQNFNLSSKSMFKYRLQKFKPSQRVSFHYALNGRYKSKGVLKELSAKIVSPGSIMISTEKEDALKEVFDFWKVDYSVERILTG